MIRTRGPWQRANAGLMAVLAGSVVVIQALHARSAQRWAFRLVELADLILLLLLARSSRTVTMSAAGVTVRMLWMERFHPWSALRTRRASDFGRSGGACSWDGSAQFTRGVFFSTRALPYGFTIWNPELWLAVHSLFSVDSFYIQFTPTLRTFRDPFHPGTKQEAECFYPVSREQFKQAIAAWGVEIEGLNKSFPIPEIVRQWNW